MTHENTPANPGQESGSLLVDTLEKNVKALVRMSAVLTRLSERLDAIEAHLDIDDEAARQANDAHDDADTDVEAPIVDVPSLALRCDGRVLLFAGELGDVELGERERWEGVILSEAEAGDVLSLLGDGFSDAGANVAAWLIKQAKRSKKEDEGEGGASS